MQRQLDPAVGEGGHAQHGDDRDQGRWWVEGDLWCRQWQHWAYAEMAAFSVVIDGDQLRRYGSDGVLVDTAVVIRPKPRGSRGAR